MFQLLGTAQKKAPLRGKQKALVRASRKEGGRGRKLAKMSGMTLSIKE